MIVGLAKPSIYSYIFSYSHPKGLKTDARPIKRLKALTVVPGGRSSLVLSPLKSLPPTKAVKDGALAYEKLSPRREVCEMWLRAQTIQPRIVLEKN